jgi:hypothetical protein
MDNQTPKTALELLKAQDARRVQSGRQVQEMSRDLASVKHMLFWAQNEGRRMFDQMEGFTSGYYLTLTRLLDSHDIAQALPEPLKAQMTSERQRLKRFLDREMDGEAERLDAVLREQ